MSVLLVAQNEVIMTEKENNENIGTEDVAAENDEVKSALEELKAAQAKLDEARAKLDEIKQKNPIESEVSKESSAPDVTQESTAPGTTQGNTGSGVAEGNSEPEAVYEIPNEERSDTPNWTPYVPAASAQQNENSTQQQDAGQGQSYYQAPPQPAYQTAHQVPPTPPNGQRVPHQPPPSGYHVSPQQQYYQQPYQQQAIASKDHIAAGLLAIFLGVFGVHKFYLGYNTAGFIMLAVTIIGGLLTLTLATWVVVLIGIIEGIMYLTKSQSAFEQLYVYNKREWF